MKILLGLLLALAAPASAQKIDQVRGGGSVTSSIVTIPSTFSASVGNITLIQGTSAYYYIIHSTMTDFDFLTADVATFGYVTASSMSVSTGTFDLVTADSVTVSDVSLSTLTVGTDIILPGGISVVNALGSLSGMAIIRADGSPCPLGWAEMTAAGGYYLVGMPFGGTGNGTKGTAMLNLAANPGHRHDVTVTSGVRGAGGAATGIGGVYTSTLEAVVPPAGQITAPYMQVRLCIIP